MKRFFVVLLCLIGIVTNINCQGNDSKIASADSIVASSGPPGFFMHPLTSDQWFENCKNCDYIYPLLILNGIIIREEEKLNYFRNTFKFTDIKRDKLISKEKAEKMGISNVPKDGVIFVTMKRGYYFDFPISEK